MTGAIATMAVTPQMLVPTAIRAASCGLIAMARLATVTSNSADDIQIKTIGNAWNPRPIAAARLNRSPSSTMPMRSTKTVQDFSTAPSPASFGQRLPITMPARIAPMTALKGDLELPSNTVPAYCANQGPKNAQAMTASDVERRSGMELEQAEQSQNQRASAVLAPFHHHSFMERADGVAASSHEYGRQYAVHHAGNAGDDHLRPETQRTAEMLEICFVDRCGVFDEQAAEEGHGNAPSGVGQTRD